MASHSMPTTWGKAIRAGGVGFAVQGSWVVIAVPYLFVDDSGRMQLQEPQTSRDCFYRQPCTLDPELSNSHVLAWVARSTTS